MRPRGLSFSCPARHRSDRPRYTGRSGRSRGTVRSRCRRPCLAGGGRRCSAVRSAFGSVIAREDRISDCQFRRETAGVEQALRVELLLDGPHQPGVAARRAPDGRASPSTPRGQRRRRRCPGPAAPCLALQRVARAARSRLSRSRSAVADDDAVARVGLQRSRRAVRSPVDRTPATACGSTLALKVSVGARARAAIRPGPATAARPAQPTRASSRRRHGRAP